MKVIKGKKSYSVANYRSVLEKLESGFAYQKIILDKKGKPVNFKYMVVNPAFEKLLGLKAVDIIGKNVTEVIPDFKKKKKDWIKFYGEVALKGKNKSCDFYSSSLKKWLHISSHSPKKDYFITEFHDITNRKIAEIQKLELNRNLINIIESISDAFVSLDKNWCYTYMNKKAGEIFGRNPKDMIGKHIWTEFPEGIGQPFHLAYEKAFKEQIFIQLEEYYSPYDKWFENRIYPSKNSLSIFFQDITDRKKTEVELRENEKFLTSIIENLPDMIFIKDAKNLNFVRINKAGEEFLGYKREELIGRNDFDFFSNKQADSFTRKDLEVIKSRKQIIVPEEKIKTKNGERIIVTKKIPVLNSKGEADYLLGISEDITERKIIENERNESEKRYRLLFENNPVPMLIYERNSLKMIAVNEAFKKHYGFDDNTLSKMILTDLYPLEQQKSIAELADSIQGHYYAGEWKHVKADGTVIDIIATSHDIQFKDKYCRIAVINDITEIKKTENAIRESEEKYRTLINSSIDGILILKNELIQFVNNVLIKLSGYTERELLGKPFINFISPKDRKMVMKNYEKRKYSEEVPLGYEINVLLKNGKELPVEINSNIFEYFGEKAEIVFLRDITERIEAQKEILLKSQELSSIYNTVGDVIFLIQVEGDNKYRFRSVNKAFSDVTGLDTSMIEGKLVNEVIPEPSLSMVLQNYINSIEKRSIVKWEETTQYPTGLKIGEVSVAPVFDFEGNCTHLVGSVHDITERKIIEDKINKLNLELEERVIIRTQQLEESNKELEAFSYSVSHDLRAPLRAITGFSKLLKEDYYNLLDEEGKEYLIDIMNNSERMANLIDDLLKLSRLGRKILDKTEINMKDLFVSIFEEEKENTVNKNIIFSISELPVIFGDYSLIKQVVINLISNAIKYTSKNPTPEIEVDFKHEGNEVIYFIKDNGIGFNMKYVHKLFGVFQRLHNIEEFEGTGVGLAIVQRIINKHNGRVWGESENDKGAVFYFSLPIDNFEQKQ